MQAKAATVWKCFPIFLEKLRTAYVCIQTCVPPFSRLERFCTAHAPFSTGNAFLGRFTTLIVLSESHYINLSKVETDVIELPHQKKF